MRLRQDCHPDQDRTVFPTPDLIFKTIKDLGHGSFGKVRTDDPSVCPSSRLVCRSAHPVVQPKPSSNPVSYYITWGVWDSLLVRAPDSRSKGCEFESRQERRGDFLPQSQLCVLTLIRCSFHPRVTAVARKRPRLFCQKCRWQVTPKHAYTLDATTSEWADYAAVQV